MNALVLLSGGLDSSLAALLMQQQGVAVTGVFVHTPFNSTEPVAYLREQLQCPVDVITADAEYYEMLKHPKHGYGRQANPCIDCHIYFLKKAREHMQKCSASFVTTGEVLGQRPMSQHRETMIVIEKEAGLEGLVVRPLSALLLDPSVPEQKQWVDRQKLLSISGRSRKPQLALAEQFDLRQYTAPSAACVLTDPTFACRIHDVCKYEDISFAQIALLKICRHFRIDGVRVVVGRDEQENIVLQQWQQESVVLSAEAVPSPVILILCEEAVRKPAVLMKAAELLAAYSSARKRGCPQIAVQVFLKGKKVTELAVAVKEKKDFASWLI